MTTTAEPTTGRPPIETRITSRQMYLDLPIGSTMRTGGGSIWTKETTDYFRSQSSGRTRSVHDFSTQNGNVIRSYPDSPVPVFSMEGEPGEGVECSLRPETLAQYMQRFETTLWGQTQNHGVNQEATDGAMRRLHVPNSVESVRPGMVVHHADSRLLRALPESTMLMVGSDSAPTVFEKRGSGLVQLIGNASSQQLLTIRSMPGVEPVDWAAEATDNEAQRVHDFMRQAWDVGMRVKSQQSWCGTFESCMLQVGISARTVSNGPSANLSVEQVAALPAGSIVRVSRGPDSVLMIRDDAMTNPARTRRLAGTVEGDWTRASVEQVHAVTGRLAIPAFSHAEMDSMPDGTAISYADDTPHRWAVKRASDQRWILGRGSYVYRSTDLALNSVRYVGFHVGIPTSNGLSRTA